MLAAIDPVPAHDVEALHAAIKAGNATEVAALLKRAPNTAQVQDENGFTALYVAAQKEDRMECLNAILTLGAAGPPVDGLGADKETPLYIAAFNNNVAGVRVLLGSGADANSLNGIDGEPALVCAARLGYLPVARLLMDAQPAPANLNLRSIRKKETALFAASKAGKWEVVHHLLGKGASKSLPNLEGKEPLYMASEKDHRHCVALLKAEKSELRDVRCQIDVELRHAQPPVFAVEKAKALAAATAAAAKKATPPSAASAAPTENLPKKKTTAVSPTKKAAKPLKSTAAAQPKPAAAPKAVDPTPTPVIEYEKIDPQPMVSIDVPQPPARTHDPFTGVKLPECKTMLEAGAYRPAAENTAAVSQLEAVRGEGAGDGGTRLRAPLFEIQAGDFPDPIASGIALPPKKK